MSFILDALRKSENERRQDTVPSVTRVPLATPRHKLPPWALGVMALLGLCVLAVSGAWWRSTQPIAPLGVEAAASRRAADAAPPAAEPPAVVAPRRETAPPTPLRRLAETSTAPSRAAAEESRAAPPPQPSAARTAQPERASRALPSATDLIARGVDLPRLTLELHSFSSDPSQRFVFINGQKYQEGESLDEGPQLLRIDAGGAVLSHQGSDFVLNRE